MAGFPPATNPKGKSAIRPETIAGASKVTSTGKGGIPASLKLKNSLTKPAIGGTGIENSSDPTYDKKKTNSDF